MGKKSKKKLSEADILKAYKRYFDEKVGMPTIAKKLGITLSEFRTLVRDAYKNGLILIVPPENKLRASELSDK
jgi:DNA-binding transcriptional regulator LsrR (DeoR family)